MSEIATTSLQGRPAVLRDRLLRSLLAALLALAAPLVAASQDTVPAAGDADAIALQTVADVLGIQPGEARVASTGFRDFPDASLGCPQPGMAYAQVITPGYRVLVEADGRRFDVRVAGRSGRICYLRKPAPDERLAGMTPPRESAETARQDLALRLDLPVDAITVTGLRHLKPGEVLDGCGEVCVVDALPSACGVGMRLHAGDRDFDYVALPTGVRPCPDIAPR